MGSAEELRAMAERQELEAIERSPAKATALIADARRTLATCRSIATKDPKSAVLLAWDGIAFPALTAALTLAGYRVTNRMGHHRVAVDAARQLLGEDALSHVSGRSGGCATGACTRWRRLKRTK